MERKLAAILSADAVGYSRLMAEDEEGTARTLAACRHLISDLVGQRAGRVVDAPGDNVLAEFPSVVDAVRCAVQIQEELKRRNSELPEGRRLLFRIGVNLGDVLVEGDRIVGDGVNVAARLESLAEPGGVCISGMAFDHVEGKLEIGFEDLGAQRVKNLTRPLRVFRVLLAGASGAAAEAGRAPRATQRWLAVAAAALAAALVIAFWQWPVPPHESPAGALPLSIHSLAVLPLENLSGEAEQEYFTVGMTEAIIGQLAKIASLSVVSRTSVMQYAGVRMPMGEIARKLGVDAVVEGSVLRAGDGVRVTVQLIDARNDRHLWAQSYERDLRDVLALQGEVARAIAREVQVVLSPADRAKLDTARPVNPEAYEAFLRGSFLQRKQGASNHVKAVDLLERAVALDPQYAPAWARLADAYT
jgi:adenylate cyclase